MVDSAKSGEGVHLGVQPAPGIEIRSLGLVGLGGAVGAATRHLLDVVAPAGVAGWSAVPWTTMLINVAGAFALGLLVSWSLRPGWLRPLLGSGFLGGFTTLSALSLDTVLLAGQQPVAAGAYALGTVVVGLLGCGCGHALGTALRQALR